MAQLKTNGTPKPEPTCYKLGSSLLGIHFQLLDKTQLFAHYSFLSHFEMRGHEEISLHYTFGVVRIVGNHLEAIYRVLKEHHLEFANPSEVNDPCRAEIEVVKIVFETDGETKDI